MMTTNMVIMFAEPSPSLSSLLSLLETFAGVDGGSVGTLGILVVPGSTSLLVSGRSCDGRLPVGGRVPVTALVTLPSGFITTTCALVVAPNGWGGTGSGAVGGRSVLPADAPVGEGVRNIAADVLIVDVWVELVCVVCVVVVTVAVVVVHVFGQGLHVAGHLSDAPLREQKNSNLDSSSQ